MLKGGSCSICVIVGIHCESCLIDCVGSMLRYREKGALVAKQRSFSLSLSPSHYVFFEGLVYYRDGGFLTELIFL